MNASKESGARIRFKDTVLCDDHYYNTNASFNRVHPRQAKKKKPLRHKGLLRVEELETAILLNSENQVGIIRRTIDIG